jgi:nucleoside-diphosphate-sugar epimerase
MKTERAKQLLRWRPQHTARQTLREMVDAYNARR